MISRQVVALVGLVAAACLAGCDKVGTEYGKSNDVIARRSLNGFSGFRNAFEQAGFDCRDVHRLSIRLEELDVIVWTPQSLSSIDVDVTYWFEDWLSSGEHTLVYVIPDSGSEVEYWKEAQQLAEPQQALEYRRRLARAINQRFEWQQNRTSVQSNGWFEVTPLKPPVAVNDLAGSWSSAVAGNNSNVHGLLEFQVRPHAHVPPGKPASSSSTAPNTSPTNTSPTNSSGGATPTASNSPSPPTQTGPTGPGDPYGFSRIETEESDVEVDFDRLLTATTPKTSSELSIVSEVTSEDWTGSRIIVVSGGSWLTNFGLTRTVNRQIAEEIVNYTLPADDDRSAGFLSTVNGYVSVSEASPDAVAASGMEMLTTWPLSLITMHAIFLGIVACLILFPIFGRPRKILSQTLSRFGDHLDAVASLMMRTRGDAYARRRISEYHRRVRGETSGPWVLPDQPRVPTTSTPNSTEPDQPRDHS